MRIKIYSRKDCHLCEEAKTVLRSFAERYPLEVEEVDIDNDPEAYEKYRYEIPVVFLEDQKLFKYKVDEKKMRHAIESRLRKAPNPNF